MAGHGEDVAIDIVPELAAFRKMIPHDLVMSSTECSIFRIPGILYRHNVKAYIPTGFSIGPWHYRDQHLQATQAIKFNYLQELSLRFKDQNLLGKLREEIRRIEGEARKCYASPIDFGSEEFVNILMLDGCFIIELLLRYGGMVRKDGDPVFTMAYVRQFLCHDLILLENQVPWLVLELLFWQIEVAKGKEESRKETNFISAMATKKEEAASSAMAIKKSSVLATKKKKRPFSVAAEKKKAAGFAVSKEQEDAAIAAKCKLIQLALEFFGNIFSSSSKPPPDAEVFDDEDIKHILDLLRLSAVLPFELSRRTSLQGTLEWQPIPCASRLNEAGVRFVKVASDSILDVRFRHGVLEMPNLIVQETTETIFRNLIGYEQCLPNCRPVFTSYAKLLDNLIETQDDIELVGKREVVDNWLSPEDAARLFNGLYNDTFVKEFFYPKLCQTLNHHCQRWWPKWRAAYIQNYFTKPWAIAAQAFALVMFVLTFLQTFFTIKN